MITLALSKGRIFEETVPLLKAAGIEVLDDPEKVPQAHPGHQPARCAPVVLVRATDVPTYVQYGGADLVSPARTPAGARQPGPVPAAGPEDCRAASAWPCAPITTTPARPAGLAPDRGDQVRGHCPRIFATKGVHVDLIKLYGSMELAPGDRLADAIVDLVSTGNTLKANHLVEVERIMDISSRLVVNQAALKLKREPIRKIIDAFASAVGNRPRFDASPP